MFDVTNSGCSKREQQINQTSKLGSGDFIEPTQPVVNLAPEMAEVEAEIPEETLCQKCLPYLYSIREPVADYQAKRGISKDETYTFYSLVTAVGTYMYSSTAALANLLTHLLPIVDAFLLIVRFVVDKLIDIMEAEEHNRPTKAAVFLIEFIPIFFMVAFIYGFIFLPLYALCMAVLVKFWHFVV